MSKVTCTFGREFEQEKVQTYKWDSVINFKAGFNTFDGYQAQNSTFSGNSTLVEFVFLKVEEEGGIYLASAVALAISLI